MTNAAYASHARTLTFNKSNWSGESITVQVRAGNKFSLHGDECRLVDVTPEQPEEPGNKWFYRKLNIVHERCGIVGSVGWFDGDSLKVASDDSNDDYFHRSAKDPVEAAVKLLCNIL
jgi:hypothetical protein